MLLFVKSKSFPSSVIMVLKYLILYIISVFISFPIHKLCFKSISGNLYAFIPILSFNLLYNILIPLISILGVAISIFFHVNGWS